MTTARVAALPAGEWRSGFKSRTGNPEICAANVSRSARIPVIGGAPFAMAIVAFVWATRPTTERHCKSMGVTLQKPCERANRTLLVFESFHPFRALFQVTACRSSFNKTA